MSTPTPLRQFRKEVLRLSVDALAKLLRTSKATVSRVERGEQAVTLDFVRRVASLSDDSAAKAKLSQDLMLSEASSSEACPQ